MLVLPGRDEGGGVDRHVPGGGSVRRYVHHPHQGHHGHRRLLCRLAAQRCFQPHQLLYVRSAILARFSIYSAYYINPATQKILSFLLFLCRT